MTGTEQTVQLTESQRALVEENINFVYRLASKYQSLHPECDMDDLISDGTIGLINAAISHNPAAHTKFQTFAFSHITGMMHRQILRRIGNGSIHKGRVTVKLREIINGYLVSGREEPEPEQLASVVSKLTKCAKETALQIYKHNAEEYHSSDLSRLESPEEEIPAIAHRNDLINAIKNVLNEEEQRIVDFVFYQNNSIASLERYLDVNKTEAVNILGAILTKLRLFLAHVKPEKEKPLRLLSITELADSLYRAHIASQYEKASEVKQVIKKAPFSSLNGRERAAFIRLAKEMMKICVVLPHPAANAAP